MKKLIRCGALTLLLCLICPQVQAAKEEFKMNINISGTVVANDGCTFAQGKSLTVDFGDVRYSAANNQLVGNYKKKLDSAMSCKGEVAGVSARMKLTAKSGLLFMYEGHRVFIPQSTQIIPLGIRLLVNGQVQDFESFFAVDMRQPPELEVELVQYTKGLPWQNGKSFSGSVMLLMEFI